MGRLNWAGIFLALLVYSYSDDVNAAGASGYSSQWRMGEEAFND